MLYYTIFIQKNNLINHDYSTFIYRTSRIYINPYGGDNRKDGQDANSAIYLRRKYK